jgi:Tol biopolymer transport system component
VILVGGRPIFFNADGTRSEPAPPTFINLDGSEADDFRLLDLGDVSDFAWAPDGRRLAIVSKSGLSTLDVDSGDTKLLYEPCRTVPSPAYEVAVGNCDVAWSPDGRTIAAATDGGLQLVDSSSGADDPMIVVSSAEPVWSPDGESIAFFNRDGWQLYTVRLDGAGSQGPDPQLILADGRAGDMWMSPIWVPAIDRILFLALDHLLPIDNEQHEILLMSVDPQGAERVELAVLGQCNCLRSVPAMVLAPDGTKALVYGPFDSGDFGLFTMDLDGSNLVRLDTKVGGSDLAWQPVP